MRYPPWSEGERRLGELRMAARFFTRLSLGAAVPSEGEELARAAWAFPVVGAAVGLLCGVVFLVAHAVHFPPLAAALVAVGAGTLATGALHEDGLADMADGLGGQDRDARLAIMRDHRSGAFGVLALVFTVGLRAVAVSALSGGEALAAFVTAHVVARGGLSPVLFLMQPARSEGLGAQAGRPEIGETGVSLLIAAVVALIALRFAGGIGALVLAALVMGAIAQLAQRALGGYTGDVLGAIEQGGEAAVLLAAAAWAW